MTAMKNVQNKMKIKESDIPDTYTLRLPTSLRKRIQRLANSRGVSLNQQIARILELYFIDAGEMGDPLKSLSGRLFEAKGDFYENQTAGALLVYLQIFDARSEREIAAFNFGMAIKVFKELGVEKGDEEEAVQEISRAVLRFHLRQGTEPEAISWSQYADRNYPNTRIIHDNEIPSGVTTLEDFLNAINQDDWFDWPFVGNYLQDLKCRIYDANELSTAIGIANEIMKLTNGMYHFTSDDLKLHELEIELMAGLIIITARRPRDTRSPFVYMRGLLNSRKESVFKTLGKDFERLQCLKSADSATQAFIFAQLNKRLLNLAPKPAAPVLSEQSRFNF